MEPSRLATPNAPESAVCSLGQSQNVSDNWGNFFQNSPQLFWHQWSENSADDPEFVRRAGTGSILTRLGHVNCKFNVFRWFQPGHFGHVIVAPTPFQLQVIVGLPGVVCLLLIWGGLGVLRKPTHLANFDPREAEVEERGSGVCAH
jgi:hypothetical protein